MKIAALGPVGFTELLWVERGMIVEIGFSASIRGSRVWMYSWSNFQQSVIQVELLVLF